VLTCPLTEGAELRALEPWQAEELAAYIERNRAHLAPWLPWARSITDVDGARSWLQRYADEQARGGGRMLGIWLDGELVGGILFRIFDTASGMCELGAWLSPEAEGRGLVSAAARQLTDWAIRVRGINRVEWHTVPENSRSIAVAKRLGMTREGLLRQAFPFGGVRHDLEIWAILAEEWLRSTPAS
jgi:ribosomal-protein-serine acetyltransferase